MAKRVSWRALAGRLQHPERPYICKRLAHGTGVQVHRLEEPSSLIRQFPSSTRGSRQANSDDFVLYENFFSLDESKQLLLMALWKLDRADSTRRRKRRGSPSQSEIERQTKSEEPASLQDLFQGDYGFEEGHYDSVIHQYRETLLSSYPPSNPYFTDAPGLLKKLYDLLPNLPEARNQGIREHTNDVGPPSGTSTHLLHLAADGVILPHVDNVEASGSIIIGASLGAERVLRLRRASQHESEEGWDIRLPNGSVYLQRDAIRYRYRHSILAYEDTGSNFHGEQLSPGHRISIMVRDAATKNTGASPNVNDLARPVGHNGT